jgi:hypothetical protein
MARPNRRGAALVAIVLTRFILAAFDFETADFSYQFNVCAGEPASLERQTPP